MFAVKLEIVSRIVTVTGPRGTLVRNLKHVPVELQFIKDGKALQIDKWLGIRKEVSLVNTVKSHITNMMIGVVQVCNGRKLPG
eukprot:COSAG05_NODE_591_length_8495_cov_3436.543116_4_plen_83_part_00